MLPASAPSGERGFTLIEVMIVVVVVAALAAIAIPSFLGQSLKAKDAGAKSDAKNISQMVEQCKVHEGSYTLCDTAAELDGTPGIAWGSSPGQAAVWVAGDSTYIVYAVSHAKSGGANHVFYIAKAANGTASRWCLTPTGTDGGCRAFQW
jgi:prepilin-type N-terminal cleavage/methylation domain-containing protein